MEDNETEKLIWDFPLRIFHWLLVFSVFGSILTGKFSNFQLHEKFGLNIIALLIFRIIWGFIGGETSKFTYFVKGPKSVIISLNNIIYKEASPESIFLYTLGLILPFLIFLKQV